MKQSTKKVYDELAGEYFKLRKSETNIKFYKEILETPYLLKMIGRPKGKRVLDLGCGPGVHAELLAKMGAKVTGIDNSVASINIARKESPKSEFVLGDIERLPFASNTFDIVLSAMVLGHLKRWDKALREVKRVLKNNGTFVFSISNPFKEVMKKVEWKGKEFRVAENYFDERILSDVWGEGDKKATVLHHHKTYGTIIKAIIRNGFDIVDYEDCKPPKSAKLKYPKAYEKTINVSNFCVWKLRKR